MCTSLTVVAVLPDAEGGVNMNWDVCVREYNDNKCVRLPINPNTRQVTPSPSVYGVGVQPTRRDESIFPSIHRKPQQPPPHSLISIYQ